MTFSLNDFYRETGTRFRVFVQSPVLEGFGEPETIWVSSPAGTLGPGPQDERMYAILPIGKKAYADEDLPPYRGRCAQPILPGPGGHFDHIPVEDPGFQCANMFGTVRRVLDVWETYVGGPFHWHFSMSLPRLELVAHVPWNNAHFGWGFMECGEGADDQGAKRPFSLNFDVLAHEVGHGLVFSLIGMPDPDRLSAAFRGFHESAADCVAMLSALHFESFLDHVLWATKGNLYAENVMSRIGELSKTRQIRKASNITKMKDVISLSKPALKATGKEVHQLGQPLTGAMFHIMMRFYMDRLMDYRLVKPEFVQAMRQSARSGQLEDFDHTPMTDAYARAHGRFKEALADARDMLGLRLAETWRRLDPNDLHYADVARTLVEVDRDFSGGRYHDQIVRTLAWRGIHLTREEFSMADAAAVL